MEALSLDFVEEADALEDAKQTTLQCYLSLVNFRFAFREAQIFLDGACPAEFVADVLDYTLPTNIDEKNAANLTNVDQYLYMKAVLLHISPFCASISSVAPEEADDAILDKLYGRRRFYKCKLRQLEACF